METNQRIAAFYALAKSLKYPVLHQIDSCFFSNFEVPYKYCKFDLL